MRPDFVFSDSSVSPSFFFTTPAKKPRTECGCHPVTFEIAAMVVPPLARSRPRTRSCLVVPPLGRDAGVVFDLSRFAGLVRGLGLVLDLAIKDLRNRRHYRRTTSTPLRSATRGVRSSGAATAPPASTTTLRSQQKSSPTSSNLVARSSGKNPRSGSQQDQRFVQRVHQGSI